MSVDTVVNNQRPVVQFSFDISVPSVVTCRDNTWLCSGAVLHVCVRVQPESTSNAAGGRHIFERQEQAYSSLTGARRRDAMRTKVGRRFQ